MSRRIIDITCPLHSGTPVWPGDPPVELVRLTDAAAGDEATVTRLAMSCHAGTHVDAPLHYLVGGGDAAELHLDAMVGPAWVSECSSASGATGSNAIGAALLEGLAVPVDTRRLLLRTSDLPLARRSAAQRMLGLSRDGAAWAADRRLALVGIDTLSVAHQDALSSAHRVLLDAGIVIVEGLDLRGAPPGPCDLFCLPLRLVGAEAAPARAVILVTDPPDSPALWATVSRQK